MKESQERLTPIRTTQWVRRDGDPPTTSASVPPQSTGCGRTKLLYLVMQDDYGIPGRGPSHEWCNIVPALESFGFETQHFDYARQLIEHGYWGSQARLHDMITALVSRCVARLPLSRTRSIASSFGQ